MTEKFNRLMSSTDRFDHLRNRYQMEDSGNKGNED
jgi:hypothetical protein